MNRFALGIPLFQSGSRLKNAGVYVSRTTWREGNRNHMEIIATPLQNQWNLDFRWTLSGEYQADWIQVFRKNGEPALRSKIAQDLNSQLDAYDVRELRHSFINGGLEIRGKASVSRKQLDATREIFLNDIWDPGFHLQSFIVENRMNRLLLPVVGDISSTLRIQTAGLNSKLPEAVRISSPPVGYSLVFQQKAEEMIVEEKLSIRDMEVRQSSFKEFSNFLDHYHQKRFWGILFTK
jgi:hypothetical protein